MRGIGEMIHAYDRIYLGKAQSSFGSMLDYAVHDMGMDLGAYWTLFLNSDISRQFAHGNPKYVAGMSGIELALDVLHCNGEDVNYRPVLNRSQEYWTGWAIAYFQWFSGLEFGKIDQKIPIAEVRGLYGPYHEMDITQFCDRMSELYRGRSGTSNLKSLRMGRHYSQRQLSDHTGIPIRTIQQYEQRQKNINAAGVETVLRICRFLQCNPEDLLELN